MPYTMRSKRTSPKPDCSLPPRDYLDDYRALCGDADDMASLDGSGAVYAFERRFADYMQGHTCLGVGNATLGILACLMAYDIRNREVITTPYTWGGTLAGLLLLENRPVFCDIDPVSLTIDPARVESLITPETGAILAVDIYGNPCRSTALRRIADRYGIPLIQDCAQSLGAEYDGKPSGWHADVSVFSFSPGKPASAGGGAVLCTPHDDIYDRLVWLTQHPLRQLRDVPELPLNEWGLNMRLPAALAARLSDNLAPALETIARHRDYVADVDRIINRRIGLPPRRDSRSIPSYYRYTREATSRQERDCIEQILRDYDIPMELTEPPLARLLYRDDVVRRRFSRIHPVCPVAEAQIRNRVWLKLQ